MNEYMLYPRNVVQISEEINRAINGYWNKELGEDDLKVLINHWSKNTNLIFYDTDKFTEDNISKSVKKLIGKKRVDIILKLLNEEE